ncbi:MAG TPA: hypothetical protein DDY22_06420 [Geobacter sp.]|nr:hypothetical protein [Geobacter sp.]
MTKAPLSVNANNASRTYGAANPNFTLSYSGFKNSDTPASLTTQPSASTTATATTPAGSYAISPSGAASTNYSLSYVAGTLTVTKATLSVTANNASRTYGDANPNFTVWYSGFKNSDTPASLTTQPSASTTATVTSPVASYAINPSGAASTNYSFSYVAGTLTVTKATLSVAANSASRTYGDANPTFTVWYSGFKNSDTPAKLTTRPAVSTSATVMSPTGNYALTPGGAVSTNYDFNYVAGSLTVNQAKLTVTANDANRPYGAANPAFTASYSGFVNGETASVLTGSPSLTTPAKVDSPAGSYPIVAAKGSLGAANYTFAFVNGTLDVKNEYLVSLSLAGSGSGTVNSFPVGISCTSGTCTGSFLSGTIIKLIATVSNGSRFEGWSGACTGFSVCQFTLSAPQTIVATFEVLPYVKIYGLPQYYGIIQPAYDAATQNAIIMAVGVPLSGDLLLDDAKDVVLQGGYEPTFDTQSGYTTLEGTLTIRQGKLIADGVKLH